MLLTTRSKITQILSYVIRIHTGKTVVHSSPVGCDCEQAHILYLDAETFYRTDRQAVIGTGFDEFMHKWTTLGCVGFNTYKPIINKVTHLLDEALPISTEWTRWLQAV
jgi:hypothetical protein